MNRPAGQVAVITCLIWTRTPHVPWQDEWELVNFLELPDRGWLELATFWSFQNEQRIVLPRQQRPIRAPSPGLVRAQDDYSGGTQ